MSQEKDHVLSPPGAGTLWTSARGSRRIAGGPKMVIPKGAMGEYGLCRRS
jgi:hypothetical protein